MCLLLTGTAIYNGSIAVPGLSGPDLIEADSMMSSGALSRSPLITQNHHSQ